MKWKNRLQTVLTGKPETENLKECLETKLRITAKSQNNGVSAVIRSDGIRHFPKKTTISDEAEKQPALVSAVIRSDEFRHSLKNNDKLSDFKTDHFHKVLNSFVESGIAFEVSFDEFQIIDSAQTLKQSDRDFIKLNTPAILCHLQQSLLMKHLFSHAPDKLEDFAFEITERESLLSITAKTTYEIYVEAVKQTTRLWFKELLENE